MGAIQPEALPSNVFCSECGRPFPPDDVARFGGSLICAECKPRFVQRMREGTGVAAGIVYGGFWRRGAALILDSIILSVLTFPISIVLVMFTGGRAARDPAMAIAWFAISAALSTIIGGTYYTYFLSQKSATPGKMVMGLQVLTPVGGRISIGRAIGRYFAYTLSGLTLCIGYVIAAFDSEKRALHDHICSTRVIRRS